MSYIRIYNPDDKELRVNVSGKELNIASRQSITVEDESGLSNQIREMCPALEVVSAPEPIKAPPKKLGKGKKGKK